MARYFGVVFVLMKAPPNIITTPQIAVNIIAFISFSPAGEALFNTLFKFS
jgi:hypothetical protein